MQQTDFDVIVVGGGFSGLYMLHRLRGLGLSARVIEAGDDVGGTWYWNRYPGARCDIESIEYSYSFDADLQNEWAWPERFSAQPDILAYLQHVAQRFDLRRDIRFSTRVTAAHWNEGEGRWTMMTDRAERLSARHCVLATGCLSSFNRPDIPGLDSFTGPTYLTGQWPHQGVDFTGRRVAVIGTGSSAIQSIPVIAAQAAQLTVFQRTPNFAVPSRNYPLTAADLAEARAGYAEMRETARQSAAGAARLVPLSPTPALETPPEDLRADLDQRWEYGGLAGFFGSHPDTLNDVAAADLVGEYVRSRIRERVSDPVLAEKLSPRNHPFASKRLCVDTGYYETYNRPNVALVDLGETPIEAIEPGGVRTTAGLVAVDDLVLATGFDAMTGTIGRIDIRGRGGAALKDKWEHGPVSYLGLMCAGFPNLYTITGPGSPSVLSNMVTSIEQHVDWVADLIAALAGRQAATIEPLGHAEQAWVEHVNVVAEPTIFMHADSWYVGANILGKPRVFTAYLGGVGTYRTICDAIAATDFPGFAIDGRENADVPDFAAFLPQPEAVAA